MDKNERKEQKTDKNSTVREYVFIYHKQIKLPNERWSLDGTDFFETKSAI